MYGSYPAAGPQRYHFAQEGNRHVDMHRHRVISMKLIAM